MNRLDLAGFEGLQYDEESGSWKEKTQEKPEQPEKQKLIDPVWAKKIKNLLLSVVDLL